METLLQPSQNVSGPAPMSPNASGSGSGGPKKGAPPVVPEHEPIVLALTPGELAELGLNAPPEPGSELAVQARAVVRPPSGADGVVLELTLTALAEPAAGRGPQDGNDGSQDQGRGSEQEAFFRSLFAGNG